MEYKIALLLKEHYRKHVEEWQKELPDTIKTEFISYHTFQELEQNFYAIKDKVDGIYVSGIIPYQALCCLLGEKESIPISYSPIDVENTYQILLQKMVSGKIENISRVGIDFLDKDEKLEELLRTGKLAEAIHSYENLWRSKQTVEEIMQEEEKVNESYLYKCKKNKIDIAVTYFFTVVESLKNFDVECFYVYPSKKAFLKIIEDLIQRISFLEIKKKMPVMLYIDTEGREKGEMIASVEKFNGKHMNRLILKESYTGVEYITDYEFLKLLTKDFSTCPLREWLQKSMDFNGAIGYGVGNNIYQAALNAVNGARYGKNLNKTAGVSVLIDETEKLTILEAEYAQTLVQVPEGYISEIANHVKLSAETILKIIGVMQASGSREITSHELMGALKISLRTANKFLCSLEKYGYASVVGMKRSGNKGRPVSVYRIEIEC